jgi:sarcosine oxidase
MPTFDIAVVGLGAVGGAAALAAARGGARVVGFDRFAPPHDRGSSHGETRIVRAAIGEGAAYTPFAQRSFALFDQLAEETKSALITRCGLLILGETLPHASHTPVSFLETTIAVARDFKIPHEVLDAETVRTRFPAFARFDGARAYFEPGAGMADPERVVAAQIARARGLGATVHLDTEVLSLAKDGDGVAIRTARETIRAHHVVLATGAWLPSFLATSQARHLTITRQTLHWFAPPNPATDYLPSRMPAFIWDDLYGFPEASPGRGVKIAREALNAVVDPDANWRAIGQDDIDAVMPSVRATFPQLGSHVRAAACLYTATPDFQFWITQHPDVPHTTIVASCSGHGFKHAPAIGEAVVGEALARPALDIPAAWRAIGG